MIVKPLIRKLRLPYRKAADIGPKFLLPLFWANVRCLFCRHRLEKGKDPLPFSDGEYRLEQINSDAGSVKQVTADQLGSQRQDKR